MNQSPFDRPIRRDPREQLMRISCSRNEPSGPGVAAPLFGNFGSCHSRFAPASLASRWRVGRVSVRGSKNTYMDQCTVGAGPLARSARTTRAEGVRREVRKKRKYSRTCSRRNPRVEGRSGNDSDPTRPKGLRGRALISMTRQATEKEQVMSFEDDGGERQSPTCQPSLSSTKALFARS